MMKIAILGFGSLGKYFNELSSKNIFEFTVFSAKQVFDNPSIVAGYDVIVDSLDPSSPFLGYSLIADKLRKLRDLLLDKSKDKHYVYLSSVQVYRPSADILFEESPTIDLSDSLNPYIHNKIVNEKYFADQIKNSYALRLPSLWSDNYNVNKGSFFSDLLLAKYQNYELDIRDGDDFIISFLHYFDAARFIMNFASKIEQYKDIKVVNVTSSTWNSRKNLKKSQYCVPSAHSNHIGYKVSSHISIFQDFRYSLYSFL